MGTAKAPWPDQSHSPAYLSLRGDGPRLIKMAQAHRDANQRGLSPLQQPVECRDEHRGRPRAGRPTPEVIRAALADHDDVLREATEAQRGLLWVGEQR